MDIDDEPFEFEYGDSRDDDEIRALYPTRDGPRCATCDDVGCDLCRGDE